MCKFIKERIRHAISVPWGTFKLIPPVYRVTRLTDLVQSNVAALSLSLSYSRSHGHRGRAARVEDGHV